MTTFEKSYFELPVSNKKSQCILDLESGKISICEVPLEYRNADCYMYAMQVYSYVWFGRRGKQNRERTCQDADTHRFDGSEKTEKQRTGGGTVWSV